MALSDWHVDNWSFWFAPAFCVVIMLGLEILSKIIPAIFGNLGSKLIPVKGKHLDELSQLDNTFIMINKFLTIMFVYHLVLVVSYHSPNIQWNLEEATFLNTVGSLVVFYIFYDFFYMNFHRILHIRWLYPLVHKHHHRQKAPSRGNLDAINVHPFEYIVGEYLHLFTIYMIPCHIYAVIVFILAGGILASLNHTRFDVNIGEIYSVKVHDVHHRIPESNYAQYTMFWDRLFGSYRAYNLVTNVEDNKDD